MAVAMYTTLAGLVGSILIKIQYYMLDAATTSAFSRTRSGDRDACRPGAGAPQMIDEFGLYPRDEPFDPFSVMLFKALQVVAFLFFIALLAMSPDAKDGQDRHQGRISHHHGLARQPSRRYRSLRAGSAGNIAWYRQREAGFLVLDRDDRGGANDFILVNGKKIFRPIRQEIVTIRGIVAGEYTVNVYHFQATTGKPVPVSVKVEKLNPTAQVDLRRHDDFDHTGEEKTAVRFTIDDEGKVIDVNRGQKSLMETFRNVRRNGARPRSEHRRQEAAMNSLQRSSSRFSVTYALIGALLLVVWSITRLPLAVKAALVVTSAFYIASFIGVRGLLAGPASIGCRRTFKLLRRAHRRSAFARGRSRRDPSLGRGARRAIVQRRAARLSHSLQRQASPTKPRPPAARAQRPAAGRPRRRFRYRRGRRVRRR